VGYDGQAMNKGIQEKATERAIPHKESVRRQSPEMEETWYAFASNSPWTQKRAVVLVA